MNEDDGVLTDILGSILKQKTKYNSTRSLQNSLELNLRSAQAPQSFDIKNFRLPTEFLNCTYNVSFNNHTNKGVYILTSVIVLVSLILSLLFLFLIHLNLISNYGKFHHINSYFSYLFILLILILVLKYKKSKILFYLSNNINETNQDEFKKIIFKFALTLKVIHF